MAVDNPLDGREADSVPWEFLDRMQSLEGVKEFIGMVQAEAGAVIADEENGLPFRSGSGSQLDPGLFAAGSIFPGVPQ